MLVPARLLEVTTALIVGQIDVATEAAVGARAHLKSGKLNALAVTADKRSSLPPAVPTTVEQGFGEIRIQHWGGAARHACACARPPARGDAVGDD